MNRLNKSGRWVSTLISLPVLFMICWYSFLLFKKGLEYLGPEEYPGFLISKRHLVEKAHYIIPFYIHVFSSLLTLLAGLPQFSKWILRRWPRVHRISGWVYLSVVLLLAAPTGFMIAFYALGGMPAVVSFLLQSILWWAFAAMALYYVRKHDYASHGAFMLRSYALALGAVSLRIYSPLLSQYFDTGPIETYLTASWMSWTINLIIAEMLIHFGIIRNKLKLDTPKPTQTHKS